MVEGLELETNCHRATFMVAGKFRKQKRERKSKDEGNRTGVSDIESNKRDRTSVDRTCR